MLRVKESFQYSRKSMKLFHIKSTVTKMEEKSWKTLRCKIWWFWTNRRKFKTRWRLKLRIEKRQSATRSEESMTWNGRTRNSRSSSLYLILRLKSWNAILYPERKKLQEWKTKQMIWIETYRIWMLQTKTSVWSLMSLGSDKRTYK
jgi:hypothetical protein